MHNSWLNVFVDVVGHHLGKWLLSINLQKASIGPQKWHQFFGAVMILLNLLRKNRRRNVAWIRFTETVHSLLTNILWTAESEYFLWLFRIPHKALGLCDVLWEVFKDNSGPAFFGLRLDQVEDHGFIVLSFEAFVFDILQEVNVFHIGSFSETFANISFARLLWSNNTDGLGKDCHFSLFECFRNVSKSTYGPDLSDILIVLNNRFALVFIILNSLFENFFCVI